MEQCPSVLRDCRLKARQFVPGCRVILLWDTLEGDQRWADVLFASLGIMEAPAFFFYILLCGDAGIPHRDEISETE